MASTDRTVSKRISRRQAEDDTGISSDEGESTPRQESARERRLRRKAEGEITMEELEEQNEQAINEELLKLIMYRSQRKWYSTISIIAIFAMILVLMMTFVALGKDISEGWKEVLLVLIGAFVGSWSKVIDFWFNNAEQDNTLLENASD
tara:strand:- start:672 stop:1118 length:447 start_codon:yes stop_codon:yes gene_type:complete